MVTFAQETVFSVAAPEADASTFAWSPGDQSIAVLASMTRQATVFAIPTGKILAQVKDLAGGARGIAALPDGTVAIPPLHGGAGGATLWQPSTGATNTLRGADSNSGNTATNVLFEFAVDRSGTRLAGLHFMKTGQGNVTRVAVYDTVAGKLVADHPLSGTHLAISPDGKRLALVQGGRIVVAATETGALLHAFQANLNDVQVLTWSPDGTRIATGALSQGYGLNPATGKYGPLLDKDVLQVWDAQTGTRLSKAQQSLGGGVESVQFSPDGDQIVTTTSDGACRIWDGSTLQLRQTVAEGLHPTTAVARFSPDSRRLAVLRTGPAQVLLFKAD
jgi:dipeptidyl aminopeptidase/acylaminoacyl peptidase